ncbi:histone-binding protein N1/N2-like isoform X2 [Halichondria panicea]|uniref:histone-binding protein N1/N2-like isoform X2 n=1 Tax=Halichondria panicea TaxID=6063 RepID=UPI00312B3D49
MSTESRSPEQCLEEGKKYLAAGYPAEAVESLQDACAILAEEYGQTAPELAEPYYLYGKALLELARSQSTVLGSGIPVPNKSSDSSDDEGDDEDAPETNGTNEATPSTVSSTTNIGETPGPSTGNEREAPGPSTANEGEAPGPSTANEGEASGSNDTNEGEEDESDLKLAWEILELARVICQKQNGEENKLKLSDVQLVLAEVSLENDQSDEAIADLNSCLQIRELFLEPHDRRLAEVHFNLGLAYILSKQPDLAISHFSSAKTVLVKRRELLDGEMRGAEVSEERKMAIKEEVSEITALLPDIKVKISDTQEMKRMVEDKENQTLAGEESGFSAVSSSAADFSKPATDISHLVRKRVVTEAGEGSSVAKKPRTQENGQASAEQ